MLGRRITRQRALILALPITGAAVSGCSDRLLRETVLASTQSMAGLAVTQNPQSQLWEARAGYSRNELFLVPTSKRVVYGPDGNELPGGANDPASTPDVVGEIRVGADAGSDALRGVVYQRLAVGPRAVTSQAAASLMSSSRVLRAHPHTGDRESALQALDDAIEVAKASGRTDPQLDEAARRAGFSSLLAARISGSEVSIRRLAATLRTSAGAEGEVR